MKCDNISIQIRENIDPVMAMHMVNSVVSNGRNDNGKYQCKTTFNTLTGQAYVYARQKTKRDSFVVSLDGTLTKVL